MKQAGNEGATPSWCIMKLKELFSYYDPTTNKIENCDKNSLMYLHELRHLQQHNTKFGKMFLLIEAFCIRIFGSAMVIVALLSKNIKILMFAGASLIPSTIVMLIYEFDAWIYSIRNYVRK